MIQILLPNHQVEELAQIVQKHKAIYEFLVRIQELKINNYFIGAGCITQTVWNYLSDLPLDHGIKDVDFVYFDDNDLSEEKEEQVKSQIERIFPNYPFKIDVKNEARVHLWYKSRFGYEIKPYRSVEEAIDTWPTTAASLGIRITSNEWNVYAPYGLDDLFNKVVRPNKRQITKEIYDKKVNRWKAQWNDLRIEPW
ncbi:nucleotidyltransferase family protein [Paenibacillus motobuensis]|uniref:nucleotidyltransferase family protein n=1 Tax=Paenibacillus TaxID=44249 RepID=UPI002041FD73|nr:nucleotidyltransferase family protein [Paenibacillus lutimineralis]MCM3645891.1 nucleotidyltransferase family protein [Paenibacillus motobuensis]